MNEPRNYFFKDVELNWARLDKPVSPFGTPQYELQVATTDKSKADEWSQNHFNVKERDGKYTVSLKRKATKADGSDNGAVRVVNADTTAFENPSRLGNGSTGNVKVFQFPYETAGRKGVASSLTAVQVVSLVEYTGGSDFDVVEVGDAPAATADAAEELF